MATGAGLGFIDREIFVEEHLFAERDNVAGLLDRPFGLNRRNECPSPKNQSGAQAYQSV